MKDQELQIEEPTELCDDLLEAVGGGIGSMMDPDG